MSVWDDLKKLFDGVIDRVEPPLPDNISTGDDVVDGLLRKLMRSGDVASQELAMNILGFQRYAQENRTMQLVQSTLDAEGISTTEIFDMEQDFNRGGIVHSAREIRAQQSFLPDGYNIDDIISRTQQAGAARGERIFNERVRAPLDRQIADVRMRSRPPANDEPHWDPETQRRGGETPDLSSGPPSSTPPANDNKIP